MLPRAPCLRFDGGYSSTLRGPEKEASFPRCRAERRSLDSPVTCVPAPRNGRYGGSMQLTRSTKETSPRNRHAEFSLFHSWPPRRDLDRTGAGTVRVQADSDPLIRARRYCVRRAKGLADPTSEPVPL